MFSKEHSPGSALLAVLTALLLLVSGLSGCIGDDVQQSPEWNQLHEDLKVDVERAFGTDHIWTPDGPAKRFNEDSVIILLYLTLQNKGDSDLSISDMMFWIDSGESHTFWPQLLMKLYPFNVVDDHRFTDGVLGTEGIILPPGDSVAGWTLFEASDSYMEADVLELRATHGFSDEPVFRIDVPVDDIEVDWSVPTMLTVEPAELRYTNIHLYERVEYGERLFVANLKLTNNWPVPARIDPDGINMTDSQGNILEPVMVGTVDQTEGDHIQIGGRGFLEITFLVGLDAVPSSINLVEDPPIVLDIDPDLIVTDFVPSRIDVSLNFFHFNDETHAGKVLLFNVTLSNPTVVKIPVGPEFFKLLDDEGIVHDNYWQWGLSEDELESVYLLPGSSIVGTVAFRLPEEVEPDTLAYDDGSRFKEFDLSEGPLLTPDSIPRFSFVVISLYMTNHGPSIPWNEEFTVVMRVVNILPFRVSFNPHNITLFDTEGRQYRSVASTPVEPYQLLLGQDLLPGRSIAGWMTFRMEAFATPDQLVYDHLGDVWKLEIDPVEIEVAPKVTTSLTMTVNEAWYTHRIDHHLADNGSRFLVLNITIENTGNESQFLSDVSLFLWDSNRTTIWQDDASARFSSYFFVYTVPPGGSYTAMTVHQIENNLTPMYIVFRRIIRCEAPLYEMDIPTIEMYPRLNITVTSMEYVDKLDGVSIPTGYRYLVINATVSNRWAEPIEVELNDFWLYNETGARIGASVLSGSFETVLLSRLEVASGVLYFPVPLGYDPQELLVSIWGDDPSIPIDPGPA